MPTPIPRNGRADQNADIIRRYTERGESGVWMEADYVRGRYVQRRAELVYWDVSLVIPHRHAVRVIEAMGGQGYVSSGHVSYSDGIIHEVTLHYAVRPADADLMMAFIAGLGIPEARWNAEAHYG